MMKQYDLAGHRLVDAAHDQGQLVVSIAPDERERAVLQEQFHLDDYDLASTLDQDEVPRVDVTDGRLLLIWKVPESATVSDSLELGVTVVGLALLRDRLALTRIVGDLSFTEREFRGIRDCRDVMLALLLSTVRHFVAHLRVIRQISAELEKKITVSMENKHLLQMFSLGESLVYYVDAIEGNAGALAKLRSVGGQCGFEPRHLEVLDDIILENAQAARQASMFTSVLSGLMDARGTIVNNNMNVLLKNLTLINIVFLPLNLIASIGGMSEWSMMTGPRNWKTAFPIFLVLMVGVGFVNYLILKRLEARERKNAAKNPSLDLES